MATISFNLLTLSSWTLFLLGVFLTAWVVFVKARGSLRYWIRPFHTKTTWALGRTFPLQASSSDTAPFLVELNALVRSLEQSASTIIREWDHEKEQCFIGLLMKKRPDPALVKDHEIREIPGRSVLRISGSNRTSDQPPLEAVKEYAQAHQQALKMTHPTRLSGQSFSLYQWETEGNTSSSSLLERLAEWSLQLRDIFIFPILLTIISLGLLGTRQPALFAVGVGLIVFLSGVCKFVFLHQRRDETQEVHLQNY